MAKGDPSQAGGIGYFPGIYQSALAQSAQDYDSIMSQYKDLATKASSPSATNPISPTFTNYMPGSDFSELRDLATTGGFSEGDVSDIRARGISPIRSIYDSAERGLSRQKALSGGYSPNYGAASAKMARESSNLISQKTTDVNAGIAEMIQRGKLAAAPALASVESRANELKNSIAQGNAATKNDFAKFNVAQKTNSFDNILKSIQGQQSLYGTTPALMNTLGSQTLNAANIANNLAPLPRGGGVVNSGPGFDPNVWRLNQPTLGAARLRRKF